QLSGGDDEEIGTVFPDEIRPTSLERSLKLEVVRHDAAAVGEGHGAIPGIEGRFLTAQDRHLVPRGDPGEQLAEVGPDSAPDPPELRSRHCELRWLVPPRARIGPSACGGRADRVYAAVQS